MISVVMPVYNCESFVGQAIDSILNQTFKDFELLIIDDGSRDNTAAIVRNYHDKRIRFIEKPANSGLIDSLNLGLGMARGNFIARMDGDDISHPSRFEKQFRFLSSNPDVALCGTLYELLPSKAVVEFPVDPEDLKIALLEYCPIGHPTVMFNKVDVLMYPLAYDPDFFAAEDYDLWTKIIAVSKIANIPEVLLSYRQHSDQVSFREQKQQASNSNKCRARMLFYPLKKTTKFDVDMGDVVLENNKSESLTELNNVIKWLNELTDNNVLTGFYENQRFRKYIEKRKKALTRKFFLHSSSYDSGVLGLFYRSPYQFRKCFTFWENIKFVVKCLARKAARSAE